MDLPLLAEFKQLVKNVSGFTRVKCTIEIPYNNENEKPVNKLLMDKITSGFFTVNKENDDSELSIVELTKVAHKIKEYFNDSRVTVTMEVINNKNESLTVRAF